MLQVPELDVFDFADADQVAGLTVPIRPSTPAARCMIGYHAHHEHHRAMPESAPVAEQRTRGLAFSQRSSG